MTFWGSRVAARLEQLNKSLETDILISENVYQRLPDDLRDGACDRGRHSVKGRDQEVHVFHV